MLMYCQESEGIQLRAVEPLVRDPEKVDEVETRLREVPNFLPEGQSLWGIVSQPDVAAFLVDDVGALIVVNIKQSFYGECHVTFWDKKLEGREALCYTVAQMVMESASLRFLITYVPVNRQRLLTFAKKVGFRHIETSQDIAILALMREEPKWVSKPPLFSEGLGHSEAPPRTSTPVERQDGTQTDWEPRPKD